MRNSLGIFSSTLVLPTVELEEATVGVGGVGHSEVTCGLLGVAHWQRVLSAGFSRASKDVVEPLPPTAEQLTGSSSVLSVGDLWLSSLVPNGSMDPKEGTAGHNVSVMGQGGIQ